MLCVIVLRHLFYDKAEQFHIASHLQNYAEEVTEPFVSREVKVQN